MTSWCSPSVHAHHIRLLSCNLHRKSGLSQSLRLADTPISAFATTFSAANSSSEAVHRTPVFFLFDFPCVSAVFPRGNASSLILIYCVNAVPGARTQTTLPLSPPPRRAMAPPSVDNGKVKEDIKKIPWRCTHHIRVIYTVDGMLLCLGYGCSIASPPPLMFTNLQRKEDVA